MIWAGGGGWDCRYPPVGMSFFTVTRPIVMGLAKHGTRSEFNFRHAAGPDRLAYAKLNETITSGGYTAESARKSSDPPRKGRRNVSVIRIPSWADQPSRDGCVYYPRKTHKTQRAGGRRPKIGHGRRPRDLFIQLYVRFLNSQKIYKGTTRKKLRTPYCLRRFLLRYRINDQGHHMVALLAVEIKWSDSLKYYRLLLHSAERGSYILMTVFIK